MELIFSNGNVNLDQHIPYDKDCLGKVRLSRNGMTEGVWAAFSPEDKKKYDNDELYGEEVIAVLCNDTLCGVPWGAYLKVELRGDERPVASCEEIFGDNPTFTLADWAAASVCEGVFKGLQEGKYKIDQNGLRDYLVMILKTAPESDVTAALKSLLEQ